MSPHQHGDPSASASAGENTGVPACGSTRMLEQGRQRWRVVARLKCVGEYWQTDRRGWRQESHPCRKSARRASSGRHAARATHVAYGDVLVGSLEDSVKKGVEQRLTGLAAARRSRVLRVGCLTELQSGAPAASADVPRICPATVPVMRVYVIESAAGEASCRKAPHGMPAHPPP